MSTLLEQAAASHRVQLAATAVLTGFVVAGTILGFQRVQRQHVLTELKASIPIENGKSVQLTEYGAASSEPKTHIESEDEHGAKLAARARQGDWDNDLILEQLSRNRSFLGEEGLEKLRKSFVVVVGCGGVGSHAATALARSGVSKIRLIDFDQVSLSSLNRHAVATLADVGTPKVACLRKRLEQITPWTEFELCNEMFSTSTAESLLGIWRTPPSADDKKEPDFVIDAIDNIDTKVFLLAYCHEHKIPVISSMGAGCKSDPTRILVGDISASAYDPLSRAVRRRLRLQGIPSGIDVAFSTEKPGPGKAQLLPLKSEDFEKGNVDDLAPAPDFRVRILPVLGTMPAVFGYAVANHAILKMTGYPVEYVQAKTRDKLYEEVLTTLQSREDRLAAGPKRRKEGIAGVRLPLDKDDVGYLVDEVYGGHSAVSGLTTRLALIRWLPPTADSYISIEGKDTRQRAAKLKLEELVCMTKEEAVVHEKEVLLGDKKVEELYPAEVVDLVKRRQIEERHYSVYRR